MCVCDGVVGAKYDIDVSTGLFKIIAPGADGTAQVEWGGEEIGG